MRETTMMPHQVDIRYDAQGGENHTPVCAGTILSAYFVLTVASCFAGKTQSFFRVRANGASKGVDDYQEALVERIHTYPGLESEQSLYDVALIRLKPSLELEANYTKMVPYFKSQRAASSSLSCNVFACQKNVSTVRLLDSSACSERRGDRNAVCTEPVADVEEVESNCTTPLIGSSLLCTEDGTSDILHGVFTMNSSDEGHDGRRVFTNVGAYAPWIQLALDQDAQENSTVSKTPENYFGTTEVNQTTDPVPYQLSIRLNGEHICSGVILDKRTALSAAHCFTSKKLNQYSVVAGDHNLNETDSTEQIVQIEKLIKHPAFTDVLNGNDIAVIRIKGDFSFNQQVSNVWISSQTDLDLQALRLAVTGWSQTNNIRSPSNALKRNYLSVVEPEKCRRKWTFLKDSMLCGNDEASFSCKGNSDFGGPLVRRNFEQDKKEIKDLLFGLTSFAPEKCEDKYQPNGFTRVSHFYEWIAEQRANSLCSASQFQCFNGDCIDKELKCDKKYDCKDGSDEKVCASFSPVTRTCGGLIKLAYSHEIQLKVPTAQPHPNSSCLWVIANPHVDSPTTQIKILNSASYQFDKGQSQLYVVQNLTETKSSPSMLTEIDSAYNFNQAFLMLYFHTNAVGENEGIHLKISDTSEPSDYIERNIKGLSLPMDVDPSANQSESQNFSHAITKSHCATKVKNPNINQNAPAQAPATSQNVVSIQFEGGHICSGVILDKKTIICPASCFYDFHDPNEIQIVAGEGNLDKKSTGPSPSSTIQVLEVARLVKHEGWQYPLITEGNDIALIHVKGEIQFNEHVNNIWISTPETLNVQGTNGSLSAWITTNRTNAEYLPDLQTLDMDILQQSECQNTAYPFLKDSMICGSKNGANVCGNSGAPLLLKNQSFGDGATNRDVLVGLSAFGPSFCESIYRPIVLTRVDYFYDWIEKNRANSICSSSEFQCYNGQCISKEKKCDYTFDCSDGSDESVCKSGSSTTIKALDSCTHRLQGRATEEGPENLFLFLKPKEGGRIQVQLDSLQMATAQDSKDPQDSLNILSHRKNDEEVTHFDGLKLRGAGNWGNETFYGGENETVLIYFHGRPETESHKMELTYIEKPRVPSSSKCGGDLELEKELEIVYQIKPELRNAVLTEPITCVWNIQTSNGSLIDLILLHDPEADFDTMASSLKATHNSTDSNYVYINKKYTKYQTGLSSTKLTFLSKNNDPNTGFHLYLKTQE